MSAPLSSGKDRDATTPLAANLDSHARALDILDELQRALDETRIAGAPQPLGQRIDDGSVRLPGISIVMTYLCSPSSGSSRGTTPKSFPPTKSI